MAKLGELNGYEFYVPESGGKAGKGFNKTGTIQVRRGNTIIKQFRFAVHDPTSRTRAIVSAKQFALNNTTT